MHVTALLCDHAQASSDGKLYVAGANITRLWTQKADPPLIVNVALAIVIEIDWNETNTMHNFEVELVYDDPAGAQIVPLPIEVPPGAPPETGGRFVGEFNAGRGPDMLAGESTLMPLAINMNGLELPAPGAYFFSVKVDKEELARARFRATVNAPMLSFGR